MKALILGVMEIFICSIILYGWYFKCLIKKEPLLKTFENDYSYCLGNPLTLVDKNGRSPVPGPADAQRMMWDYCVDQYHDALDAIKDEWDSKMDAIVE